MTTKDSHETPLTPHDPSPTATRMERDTMGELAVPAAAYYGVQTARAVENFPISDLRFPRSFIRAMGLIKHAAATVNAALGLLDKKIAGAILSFAKAMGEFGATITFVSNIPGETQTLPSAIYTLTQVPGGDAGAWRLTAIAVVVSLGALLVAELMARRLTRRLGGA